MKARNDNLDAEALLAKNPKAAKVFKENKKKLDANKRERRPKEYGIGLPYARSAFVSDDRQEDARAE